MDRAYLERTKQGLIDAHHRTSIVKLATIVWRAENSDELSLGEKLVPLLHDLMRPYDELEVVLLQEAGDDVSSKREGNAAVVLSPARDFAIRI